MRRTLISTIVLSITIWIESTVLPTTVLAQNGDISSSSSEFSDPSEDPPQESSSSHPNEPSSSEEFSSSEPVKSSAESSEYSSSLASSILATVSSSASSSASESSMQSSRPASTATVISSSASESSSENSIEALSLSEPSEDLGFWDRENFGYAEPVIDPSIIARPASFVPDTMGTNALLALLTTLVIGFGGEVLRRLLQSDTSLLRRTLGRLPLQAILTIVLIELYEWLMPVASAQGVVETSASLVFHVPLYAFLFLLVTGVSNGLLNALAASEGKRVKGSLSSLPGVSLLHSFLERKEVRRAFWFLLLLILLYGIIGSYINPQFSLFPSQNLGIILVAVVAVTVAAYTPDALRYFIARSWKSSAWFEGNITGLLVALLCVYLSRRFQLSPGYIYGLPVGLFLLLRGRQSEGLLQFLSLSWMLGIALLLWLILPIFSSYAVPYDTANLLFIILLEGVFFELLPLPSVAGGTIFQWKILIWAVLFFVVVFLLFQVLFHPLGTIGGLQESPTALFTLISVGCYAVGIVVLWGYVLWTRRSNKNS